MTLHFDADTLTEALIDACTRPQSIADLKNEWDLDDDLIESHVQLLIEKGILVRVGKLRVSTPSEETAVGFVASNGPGRFHVIPDDQNIPLAKIRDDYMGSALIGDRVLFHVVRRSKGRDQRGVSVTGRIMSILKERPSEVVGVYDTSDNGSGFVRLQGKDRPKRCVILGQEEGLSPGTLVRVSLPRAPGPRGLESKLIEVVADIDCADDDTLSICSLMDLPLHFPEEVTAAAEALPDDPSDEDFEGRLDLRDVLTITIDPADAKDHDDAVSIEPLENGLIRVGVHIADVSHYVTPDSIYDVEAYERGTSAYLPGHTVPMLPMALSAGLCSLKEGRDRLAKSVFFIVAKNGSILRREVYKSIVRVDRFFNYEEVFAHFEGRQDLDEKYTTMFVHAREAANRLKKKRVEEGSVSLSIDRAKLRIGEDGNVVEVKPDRQNEANRLVEDFMLAANRAIARFMLERDLPYICRQHPSPKPSSEDEFAEFCTELGVAAPSFQNPRAVQMFLDGLENLPGKEAIHLAVLKSMMRASYEDKQGLHYALGFHEYTHFTSPIRRLCDLTVHQILDQYFEAGGHLKKVLSPLDYQWMDGAEAHDLGKDVDGSRVRNASTWRVTLKSIAHQANQREQRASKAEIKANQLKLLRLVSERVGEVFEGTCVHIMNGGVIFQLDELMVEGMLSFHTLCDAWVTPRKFWVEYPSSDGTKTLRVGDRMTVEIAEVDLAMQQLSLCLPGGKKSDRRGQRGDRDRQGKPASKSGKRAPRPGPKKPSSGKGHRKGPSASKPGAKKKHRAKTPSARRKKGGKGKK